MINLRMGGDQKAITTTAWSMLALADTPGVSLLLLVTFGVAVLAWVCTWWDIRPLPVPAAVPGVSG